MAKTTVPRFDRALLCVQEVKGTLQFRWFHVRKDTIVDKVR
jgi:hypothetical protein